MLCVLTDFTEAMPLFFSCSPLRVWQMDVTLLDAGMHDNIGLTFVEHHDRVVGDIHLTSMQY